jgi:hypothetical protein
MSKECPAGCCPHDGIMTESGCPGDLPQAPLPERAAHLYACQGLSTYKIAAVTSTDRQRITRQLRKAGIAVKPRGAGRRETRAPEDEQLDALMAALYLEQRMPSSQVAGITGIPDRTVRQRLRARGVPMRTRGRYNREDRVTISPDDLTALYVRAGLSADETGGLLGVSRRIVLRSAHDQGLPVRVGGSPPASGPAEIELLAALYADPQARRVLARHGIPGRITRRNRGGMISLLRLRITGRMGQRNDTAGQPHVDPSRVPVPARGVRLGDHRALAALARDGGEHCAGGCLRAGPAWATGKPLSPKQVILDLRDHAFAKAPYLLASSDEERARD